MGSRISGGMHMGPTSLVGVAYPLATPRGLVASRGGLCLGSHVPCVSSIPEKNLFGSFIPFGLRLIFSYEKGQKHGKTGTGTWH